MKSKRWTEKKEGISWCNE